MRSMQSRRERNHVKDAIDTLVVSGEWTGNIGEVWATTKKQCGYSISDYIIKSIVKMCGEEIRRGQYRITRKAFNKAFLD